MARENALVPEYMVPHDDCVAGRVKDFYKAIGWIVSLHEDGRRIRVAPDIDSEVVPALSYWLTDNDRKKRRFSYWHYPTHSQFSVGLRLPTLEDLIEVPLLTPHNDDVVAVYERGGEVLASHAHISPREHPLGTGRLDMRFVDPFNFSVRVAGPLT